MVTTTNKGYELQVTGTNTNTWGDVLNDDVIDIIDLNLGGYDSVALASSPVTLTPTQSQNLILRFTGTLTANVTVTTECIGITLVENLTTGNFTVTFRNDVNATGVALPQSQRCVVASDATNGCRIIARTYDIGTIASQNANNVAITGGTITGLSSPLALASGGTGAALVDPNGDRLVGWNDTDGAIKFFTIGTNLTYDEPTDTLSADAYPREYLVTQNASGTQIDFTGIPSWATEIKCMFSQISLNGTEEILIQVGTSSGIVTSGYTSSCSNTGGAEASASGLLVSSDSNASFTYSGTITISKHSGNIWVSTGILSPGLSGSARSSAGRIDVGGTLDRIRFTSQSSNSFDGGVFSICYS